MLSIVIGNVIGSFVVILFIWPFLYALAPKLFEDTVEMVLNYERWAGKLIIAFVVGVFGDHD